MPEYKIKFRDVVRFRKGAYALMMVDRFDDLCGYRTYHGVHLFGENISVASDECRLVTKEEKELWDSYRGDRQIHSVNIGEGRRIENAG